MEQTEIISYLAENGMGFGEIQAFLHQGLTLEQLAEAVHSRLDRGLPAVKDPEEKERKPALTLEALGAFLEEKGIRVRYNVISKEIQVEGMPVEFNPETLGADLHIILHDCLKSAYRCSKDQVADLLGVAAGVYRYNPVADLLESAAWDGRDRFGTLFECLHIPAEDGLSRLLFRKWMAQSVAMARNELEGAYGADGVLVLTGPQGIGKTSLVKALGMRRELYKLGQWLDNRDKDTYRRCTSAWIVELGELETTLRSDLERLKAFVTAERDEYRLPYGRADQVLARRTSLVATCNSREFLVDPTGSRRFWTVPLEERIDLEALAELDMLQLWKQAEAYLAPDGQSFRLTAREQARLAERNVRHGRPVRGQEELEDILYEADSRPDQYEWVDMTVSDFKAEQQLLRGYSVGQIAQALDQLDIRSSRVRVDGKVRRTRRLPRRMAGT